jgi:hypothetical protein
MSFTTTTCPKRFALRYNPPTLIVDYQTLPDGKYKRRSIVVCNLRPESDAESLALKIVKKNEIILSTKIVSFPQVCCGFFD